MSQLRSTASAKTILRRRNLGSSRRQANSSYSNNLAFLLNVMRLTRQKLTVDFLKLFEKGREGDLSLRVSKYHKLIFSIKFTA